MPDLPSRIDPVRRAASRLFPWGLLPPCGSRADPSLAQACPGCWLHSVLFTQGAQSPPPIQPRERMLGTEFNRHHQQPPGKLGKVDTLILVTVSGEQAQGRSLLLLGEGGWGPTPHWAQPLPGRCHGDGPYRKQARLLLPGQPSPGPRRGGWRSSKTTEVARGTTEVTRHLPRLPFPPARPAEGSSLCK